MTEPRSALEMASGTSFANEIPMMAGTEMASIGNTMRSGMR